MFENVGGVVRNTGDNSTDDFVFGNDVIDGDEMNQFFFDKSKGAFRAGNGDAYWAADSLGGYSFASGYRTQASGVGSTAMGFRSTAEGARSVAIGNQNIASGWTSSAMGDQTKAHGHQSTAMGFRTQANGTSNLVVGRFNDTLVSNAINPTGADNPLFIVGNGNSASNLSNALTVYYDGRMQINDAYTLPTARWHSTSIFKNRWQWKPCLGRWNSCLWYGSSQW